MIKVFASRRLFTELSRGDHGENAMLRVDGAYLYDFGSSMRALQSMEEKDCTRIDLYFPLSPAYDALEGMVYQSVFSDGWRVVHTSAKELLEEIKSILQ